MEWSSALPPLIGTTIGILGSLSVIVLKNRLDKRSEFNNWFRETYIHNGIQVLIDNIIDTNNTCAWLNRDKVDAKVIKEKIEVNHPTKAISIIEELFDFEFVFLYFFNTIREYYLAYVPYIWSLTSPEVYQKHNERYRELLEIFFIIKKVLLNYRVKDADSLNKIRKSQEILDLKEDIKKYDVFFQDWMVNKYPKVYGLTGTSPDFERSHEAGHFAYKILPFKSISKKSTK